MNNPTWFDTTDRQYDVRPLLSYEGMKDELKDSSKALRHSPIALGLFWGLVAGDAPYDINSLPDETYNFVNRYWRGESILVYQFLPSITTHTYIFIVGSDILVIAGWYTNAPFDRVVNHFMESGHGLNP